MANQKHTLKTNTPIIVLGIVSALMAIAAIVFLVLFIGARSEISCLEKDINELREEYGIDVIDDDYDDPNMFVVKKPMIYLYPTEDTEVTIKFGHPDKLSTVYPKYSDGWNVLAYPNGDLADLKTGRSLYGLYWEGNDYSTSRSDEGFVVRGSDSAEFLEVKLAQLGLSEHEAEEMIVYWLPKLEANAYNYIRFDLNDEMDAYMPLEVSPKPDTMIRVMMVFEGLDAPIEVTEQHLPLNERSGFTVVEWGGSEIK